MIGAFAPALGAIVVRLLITHEGFGDAGLKPNLLSKRPYYIFAWIWPLLLVGGLVVLALVAGAVLPGFSLPSDALLKLSNPGMYGPLLLAVLVSTLILWGE